MNQATTILTCSGSNLTIGTNVTIGGRGNYYDVPVIEDEVEIGTGAKILGPIIIGRGAKIGANAVVLCNAPEYAAYVGIPARAVDKKVCNQIA